MRAQAFAEYMTAGAVSGAVFNALGATAGLAIDQDFFQPGPAALAGFVGGATTHASLGLLASLEGRQDRREVVADIWGSLPLVALTSGVIGAIVLSSAGYPGQPPLDGLIASGLLGGALIGLGAGLVACALGVVCPTERAVSAEMSEDRDDLLRTSGRVSSGALGDVSGEDDPEEARDAPSSPRQALPVRPSYGFLARVQPWEDRTRAAGTGRQP